MKYTDYVMNIMASWMTLDELEGAKTIIDFIERSGTKDANLFTYHHLFLMHFKYRHKLDDHNKQIHVPIYLERTLETKFYTDRKFPGIFPCQKVIKILSQVT